jgi:glycosyltransferase involved in cell wall biosynthesis
MASGPLTIGYIVSMFPCWSETFILREILALRKRGVNIRILSLKPADQQIIPDGARQLLDMVIYPDSAWRFLASYFFIPSRFLECPSRCLLQAVNEAGSQGLREMVKAAYTVTVATEFAGLVRQLGIVHIHAHWATYPSLAARTISRLTGVPYTLTCHAHDIFRPNPFLHTNLASARTVLTISEYNRRHLISLGIPAEHIEVARCGVDLEEFAPVKGDKQNERRTGLIVTIARLDPKKGLFDLIEACAILKKREIEFSCKVIGEGPLRNRLERRIAGHELQDKVHLLGMLNQSDVRKILKTAQLFVLPCVETEDGDRDGIPVALMEAMALEIPVITTPVSGIPELVINGVSGLMAASRDPISLANTIECAFMDRSLRKVLGMGGRKVVVERHDVSRLAFQMEQVFLRSTGVRLAHDDQHSLCR